MAVITITITDVLQADGSTGGVDVNVSFQEPYKAHCPTLAQNVAMQLANTLCDISHEVERAGQAAVSN